MGVTPAQLREAERGLGPVLGKKFSAAWIAKNGRDLLAQANVEYAEWLESNPPARNPVGWLLNGARWRALNLFDSETRKPREVSLEALFHLPDESTPSPEEQALDGERQRRLRKALEHLPDKECKLLSLVYYEDMSIREAGRKLGWRKSAADRHHDTAMEKLLALVGDRSLLTPATLGPIAWTVVNGEGRRALRAVCDAALGPPREGLALGSEAVEALARRLAEQARRLLPFTETGNAAAAGGGGRVLGYCGAAAGAVVCGLLGSGAVGPGVGTFAPDLPKSRESRPLEARPASAPAPPATPTPAPAPQAPTHSPRGEAPKASEPARPKRRRARNPLYRAPVASGRQSQSEFGDNNFEPGSGPESSPPAKAPAESSPAPSPSSGSQSSGSSAGSEFGL
jgi:RNA polymerase sigma factor (sigma-70 family)